MNEQVLKSIREKYSKGAISHSELSEEYKISKRTVGRIINSAFTYIYPITHYQELPADPE